MSRVLLPCVLAAVVLAAGCGGADSPPAASDATSPSASPSASRSASPSASSAPTTTATASPERPRPRKDKGDEPTVGQKMEPSSLAVQRADGSTASHLLTAEQLPEAGDGVGWTTVGTAPEGSRRVGLCQQASLFDIGALRALLRVHVGPDGSGLRARQVVARYADRKSAWRAEQVLLAWREDCEESVDDAEVGPLRTVLVEPGRAARYRAGTDTRETSHGVVRHGRWLSLVDVRTTDSAYPADWTARALRRIAATF